MTAKITVNMKVALVAAHESGCAKSSSNGNHLAMLNRLITMGLLTNNFRITNAGRVAIGVKPVAQPKRRATVVEFVGITPLARVNTSSFPIYYN